MSYFRKHWHGELSLAVSFWVNFVFINSVLGTVSALNEKQMLTDYPVYIIRISLITVAVLLILVSPWQLVGLWRAGTNHARKNKKHLGSVIVKTIVILALCVRLGQTVFYWPVCKDLFKIAFLKDDLPGYTINLLDDGAVLHFDGWLPFGTSKEVAAVLEAHPDINKVILDSPGGRLYEARKIAELILQRQLDTYTVKGCYSGATLPFAAGKNRFLCKGAALGFHQYSTPESIKNLYDVRDEYQKDRAFYQSRGVTKEFQDKMFTADPNDFWIPSSLELYNGGMIHAVVKLTDILPMEEAIIFGYDISRKPSKMPSDLTKEQIKGWILGCSGLLWEFNRDGFDSLWTWKVHEHRAGELKEMLSDGWSIENRNDVLQDLYWLSQEGGHRDNFARDGWRVCEMTNEEFEEFLEQYKERPQKCNDFRIARQYYQTLGDKGILGWDLSRYMCLCRWGYICGWLDEKTAWELMIPIAREIQQVFHSWDEAGQNYLIGRHYWSLKHIQEGKEGFDEALWRLTEMPSSPWNKYPWDMDLSGAYSIVPDPPEVAPVALLKQEAAAVPEPPAPKATETSDAPMPKAADLPDLPEVVFSKVNTLSELKEDGPVLVVPDEYATIQAAVVAAEKGDTVFVRAGRYDEHVVLSKKNGIRLVGENTDSTVLHLTDPNIYHTLFIQQCRGVTVSDLTVIKPEKTPTQTNCALTIHGSAFEIVRCRITNARGRGVECASGSIGTIRQTRVESCLSSAVMVLDSGTHVTVLDSCIRDNQDVGIVGYIQGKVTIRNTQFERNKNSIFIVQKGSQAAISNCRICGDTDRGIIIQDAARVRVEDTLLESCKKAGFFAAGKETSIECVRVRSRGNGYDGFILSATGTLKNCVAERNGRYGIYMKDSASVTVENCLSQENEDGGILVAAKETTATLVSNQCLENERGIVVGGGALARASDNVCRDNKGSGILVRGNGASAVLTGNHCFKNKKSGIRVYDGASAEVRDNLCENNTQSGIDIFHNGASALLQNNHCLENQQNGIGVFEKGSQAEIQNNRCSQNSKSGIRIADGASAEVRDNLCQNNKQNGIDVFRKGASAILESNQCLENQQTGIVFSGGGTGTIKNCICENNKQNGIAVFEKGSQAEIQNNRCLRNGRYGISFWNGGTGTAADCLCEENNAAGIFVSGEGTRADLTNNQCQANRYNGIVVSGNAGPGVNLTGNACLGNYPSGIFIDKNDSGVQLHGNRCQYNPWAGIAVKGEGTNPTLIENTLDNNGTWGIRIWGGAKPELQENSTENNGIGGIKEKEQDI